MPSPVFEWLSNFSHPLEIIIYIFVVVSAVYTIIINYSKIIKYIVGIFSSNKKKDSLNKLLDDVDREDNPRFGFSFLYPKLWDRLDPINGDGNTYIHPLNDKIKILAWGHYALSWTNLEELVEGSIAFESEKKNFKLIKRIFAGKFVHGENSRSQIDGVRIVYSFVDQDNIEVIVMKSFTQMGDTQFTISCETPSKHYNEIEVDFLKIISSLTVILSNKGNINNFPKNEIINTIPIVNENILLPTYPSEKVVWKYESRNTEMINNNFWATSLYDKTLYVGLQDKAVGINIGSGECVWKCNLNSYSGAPLKVENSIVVACNGWLYSWSATESNKIYHRGNALWKFEHHSEHVYFKTCRNIGFIGTCRMATKLDTPNHLCPLRGIAAIDLLTGIVLWFFDTYEEGIPNPQIYGDIVYFATDKYVYALRQADGSLLWKARTGDTPSGIIAPISLNQNYLVVGSSDPMNPEYFNIHCFNIKDGTRIRDIEVISNTGTCMFTSILLKNQYLFGGTWEGIIYIWNVIIGKVIWKSNNKYPHPFLNIVGEKLIIAYSGGIASISWKAGTEISHIKTSRPEYITSPIIDNETAYISSNDGFVYAIKI